MTKITPTKPVIILPYGYPGSGKTYFSSQLGESINIAHLSSDRLRHELYEKPTFSKQENETIDGLMQYLAEEFLRAGASVIFDSNLSHIGQRRQLQAIARQHQAISLVAWFQIDIESAFLRIAKRDRRKSEDRFAEPHDRSSFDDYLKLMQNPKSEEYVVLSGKHTFNTQKSAVVKKMYEMGLISAENATSQVIKPGLVNLIPPQQLRAGRVDETRRNIVIR